MTEEMRYVVRGESRAQFRRWDNDVPGVRVVRAWLRDSLGFENATNEDAKQAQKILRAEFDEIEPRFKPPSMRPKGGFFRNPPSGWNRCSAVRIVKNAGRLEVHVRE